MYHSRHQWLMKPESGAFAFSSLGRKIHGSIDDCPVRPPRARCGVQEGKKTGRFETNLRHPAARRANPDARLELTNCWEKEIIDIFFSGSCGCLKTMNQGAGRMWSVQKHPDWESDMFASKKCLRMNPSAAEHIFFFRTGPLGKNCVGITSLSRLSY